jgi:hypothetical protein
MSLQIHATRWLLGGLSLAFALPAAAIVGGTPTDAFAQVSNGVQITENWVLTARHVGFTGVPTFTNGYGSATIAARYDLGSGPTLFNDLSLLRLSTSIQAPALSLLSDLLPFGTLTSPLDVTIATGRNQTPRGYGQTVLAEVINQVQLEVDKTPANYDVNWLLTYDALHGAPYVEGGDSGGGLFLGHVTDSAGALLMGITSAKLQFDTAGGRGFGSAFVQLAAYRDWIDTTMRLDATDTQMARWVSAVPEPLTTSMWLAGLLVTAGMGTRRQKQRNCSDPHAPRV